jgi:hypothetical protein
VALLTAFGSPYHSRPSGSRIGNQIDAAMILAAADFLSLDGLMSRKRNKTKV